MNRGLHLIDTPSGRYCFAGSVPEVLALICEDGVTPPTREQLDIAHQVGPRFAHVKTRTWVDAESAIAAARAIGYEPQISPALQAKLSHTEKPAPCKIAL